MKKVFPAIISFFLTTMSHSQTNNVAIVSLGQDHCPKIKTAKTWSGDNKSWTFEADLKPGQHYQIFDLK